MKKYPLLALLLTFAASWIFSACDTSSDDVYEVSRDCIITSVTLGSLNRPMHTTSSTGADSVYIVKVNGGYYPMHIDHLNGLVYNSDSLPKGTDVTKVVFTKFNVTGSATIRSLHSGKDTIFSALDSTDFSTPRTITVTAQDVNFKRVYTVDVRVHREEPDTFAWQRLQVAKPNAVTPFVESRALSLNRELFVFGQLADGSSQLIHTSTASPAFETATAVKAANGAALDVRSVQYFKNSFYALAKGALCSSTSAVGTWTMTASDHTSFDALAGCSSDSIFAIADGKMFASADALHWTESAIDTPNKLPTHNIVSTTLKSRAHNHYENILVAGNLGEEVCVWKRDLDLSQEYSYPWMLLPQTEELGRFGYPNLLHANLMTYDESTLLAGVDQDGKVAPFYLSRDNGRIWKTGEFKHPAISGVTSLCTTVDADHYVWMFCSGSGEIYRGRLNRLGWAQEEDRFEKGFSR